MTLYVFLYRRDAYETIYVEAEDAKEACKIADQKEEEINWENADYDVDCADRWEASAQEEEDYRVEHLRSQLCGFH